MRTLAIDVGGTKFSIALFDGEQMVRRESRRTDAEGGRDWMLGQISSIARAWQNEMPAARCGIGFGGPVIFTEQRVALSTHVGGWRDFHLTDWVRDLLGVPAIMDNDANVGALGEARFGAGLAAFAAVLHDALDRHWRRHLPRWAYLARRRFLWRRDRPPDHPSRWSPVPLRLARLFRAHVQRLVAGARLRQNGGRVDARSRFRQPLRGGSGDGIEGLHHAVESRAHRDWRRHRESRRRGCSIRCARNCGARSPIGPARASMWSPPRWATIACCGAPWRWRIRFCAKGPLR